MEKKAASDNRYLLRSEARPVRYKRLQKGAKDALKRIIPILSAAADDAKMAAADSGHGSRALSAYDIDTNRASRLFFVSGEPGSGKSTLYLTLKAMLSDEDKFRDYSDGYDNLDLGKVKRAARWLEPIDLEVTGDEGENLLAAVLVRLFSAFDQASTVLSKPCEDAIKELEELAADIGIAWEGNLRARAGSLDPATYSEEVMLAQRARLGVNKRLRQALDNLAKNKCCGCSEETLFILPVEDLYLKPNASLQLLRLLRMITVPRLFFLAMGDIKTVEALFTEKSLADWTAVAGAQTFISGSERGPERLGEALARARELRARYLRKLLPPEQRVVIEAMAWDEALKFKPERPDGELTVVNTLKDLLEREKVDLAPGKSEIGLLAFLVSPAFEDRKSQPAETDGNKKKKTQGGPAEEKQQQEREAQQQEPKKEAQEAYTALQILDATPREILDLWTALNAADVDSGDARELLPLIERYARLEIDEQSFLNETEQGVVLGVFPTRTYFAREFDMNCLRLESDSSRWSKKQHGKVWICNHRAWKMAPNPKSKQQFQEDEWFNKLPPRPTAWMVLLHDLAWTWKNDSVSGNLVERLCKDITEWKPKAGLLTKNEDPSTDFPGWAVLHNRSTYQHFPMPNFQTFRDLDRFLFVWRTGIGSLDDQSKSDFFSVWALAGWTILVDAYQDFASEGNWYGKFAAIRGNTFQERFEKLKETLPDLKYPDSKEPDIKNWLQKLDKLREIDSKVQSSKKSKAGGKP
jgi:hypothetical protein